MKFTQQLLSKMVGKETPFIIYRGGYAQSIATSLLQGFLPIVLSLGCSLSLAQVEPNAGKWKTWVLSSGDQLRLPPPPDEAAREPR
jgi:hypothetical protein